MTFAKVNIVGNLMLLTNPVNNFSNQILRFNLFFKLISSFVEFDTSIESTIVGYTLMEFAISTTYSTLPVITNVRTSAITATWRAYVSFYWFLDKTSQVRSKDGLFPQLFLRGPVSKSLKVVKMSFLLAKPFLCL